MLTIYYWKWASHHWPWLHQEKLYFLSQNSLIRSDAYNLKLKTVNEDRDYKPLCFMGGNINRGPKKDLTF